MDYYDNAGWHVEEITDKANWWRYIKPLKYDVYFCPLCRSGGHALGGCIGVSFTASLNGVSRSSIHTRSGEWLKQHEAVDAWNKGKPESKVEFD